MVREIIVICKLCLQGWGLKCSDSCAELLQVPSGNWLRCPLGWEDQGGMCFGAIDKRGFIGRLGGGRLFEGENVKGSECLRRIQEYTRPIAAAILGILPEELTLHLDETVGVKPPGSDVLELHIDGNRLDDIQIAIALVDTTFLVCPRSHQVKGPWRKAKGFYAMKKDDLRRLPCGSTSLRAKAGDVLVMRGGEMVHGSPSVGGSELARFMAYSAFNLL